MQYFLFAISSTFNHGLVTETGGLWLKLTVHSTGIVSELWLSQGLNQFNLASRPDQFQERQTWACGQGSGHDLGALLGTDSNIEGGSVVYCSPGISHLPLRLKAFLDQIKSHGS